MSFFIGENYYFFFDKTKLHSSIFKEWGKFCYLLFFKKGEKLHHATLIFSTESPIQNVNHYLNLNNFLYSFYFVFQQYLFFLLKAIEKSIMFFLFSYKKKFFIVKRRINIMSMHYKFKLGFYFEKLLTKFHLNFLFLCFTIEYIF